MPHSDAARSLPWTLLGPRDQLPMESGVVRSREEVCALLDSIEQQVKASPASCFTLDATGAVTLHVEGASYHAGRFETPTLATLEARVAAKALESAGRVRLSILRGSDPLTDIGTLQATAPADTLFQVASQFNCLEAPGNRVVAISKYPYDATQGPRASVSAFPGTFVRHYFAPEGSGGAEARFVQTDHKRIDLLADVLQPEVAQTRSGYLTSETITDTSALAIALTEKFGEIRVGVHDDVQVVLGSNWGGGVAAMAHRIAQVFTSTIAQGGYGRDDGSRELATVRQQLLRAAYLGTLLAAISLGKRMVVLTLIGGGVFSNPRRAIWDAIHWAVGSVERYVPGVLDVVVNAHGDVVEEVDVARAAESGGDILEISATELRLRRR